MSGIVEMTSKFDFSNTLERLTAAIEAHGMTIFASIDHAAGAREAGLSMPPTTVLVYGNPKGGTPIMQAAPLAALDLPLRVLVREDDGRVLVAFHPVVEMLKPHGVSAELARRLDPAQHVLVEAIVQ